MKTISIFLLLSSLRVGVVIASDTQQHNDTDTSAAEASINGIGDVELEDLRMSELIDKIEEAVTDGSFGDADMFEDYASNNGFGTKWEHSDIRFTSKGAIDITKLPMPDGVPSGFPKTRKAFRAVQFSKDDKKKEMRFKELYDDLVANEEEWMEFLDHRQNSEFAYECLRVSYEYALIRQKNEDRDMLEHLFEMADVMKKLINVQQKHIRSVSEKGKELFEEIEFLANYFIWNSGLWKEPREYGQLFKKLVAYEVRVGWRPLVMEQWEKTRKEMKARGIDTPSNIEDVDDEVLHQQLVVSERENASWKKLEDSYGSTELKKDLINFFEMNDNIVSHQKQERINKFVDKLSGPQATIVYSLFGYSLKDEIKEFHDNLCANGCGVNDLEKFVELIAREQGNY